MTVLNKCCCCFGLRTGALIIGWLGLVGSISDFVYFICHYSVLTKIEIKGMDSQTSNDIMTSVLSSVICHEILGVIMNAALIYGVNTNKKLMLLPWLISKGIGAVSITLMFLFGGLACFFIDEMKNVGAFIWVIGIPICGIFIYIWMCILSLYQRFNEEQRLNARRRNEEAGQNIDLQANRLDTQPPAYCKLQNV